MALDDDLLDIIRSSPAATPADVAAVMGRMDALLPETDGLKWFNHLYLAVTDAFIADLAAVAGTDNDYRDPAWLARLDVVFGRLYFSAFTGWVTTPDGSGAPRAWRPLLARRTSPGLLRLQFALAGMNAHINRDLPLAVVQTCREAGTIPAAGSPQHEDFERVNGLLAAVEDAVKPALLHPLLEPLDFVAGRADDVMAMWSVRAARDAAWRNSEILWHLDAAAGGGAPFLAEQFRQTLDRMTGFASRGLLAAR